jgi:hypothetical protein
MEKLRIFFIYALAWTNQRLYRAAVVCERLMYFVGVQMPVAHQFTGEQQHRNLMAVARFCGMVGIDVEHVNAEGVSFGQCCEFAQHLLAQAAPGAGVKQKVRWRPHDSVARKFSAA